MASTRIIMGQPPTQNQMEELCEWCQKPIGSNNLTALILIDENRNELRGIYTHSRCPDEEDDNAN
jgi:hypothetical protein